MSNVPEFTDSNFEQEVINSEVPEGLKNMKLFCITNQRSNHILEKEFEYAGKFFKPDTPSF